VIGGGVWFTSSLRSANYMAVQELDPDDDLKVQGILSWFEDFFSFGGVVLVVIAPILAMIVALLTVAGLYAFRAYLSHREKKKMVPCTQCGESRHLCGARCHRCGHQHEHIHQVGFMGMIRKTLVTDLHDHQFQMTTRKRCFQCGERYKEQKLIQACSRCGRPPFRDEQEARLYLGLISGRLGKTLLYSCLFGIVPIVGLIPGIIYYRVNLISCMRGYIPRTTGCLVRWIARVAILLLIASQGLGAGFIALPLMCLINYGIYHAVFQHESRTAFTRLASQAG
jgi:hypothetical protein